MRYTFSWKFSILLVLFLLSGFLAQAQDTVKRTAVKPATPNPATTTTKPTVKPSETTNSKAVSSGIPVNPKNTKLGYGTKTDTTKKASTLATETPAPVDKSLNGQYQYLLTKVYSYQKPFVAAFWKNVSDSLNRNKQAFKAASDSLAAHKQTITQLQHEANNSEALANADSINFLGISFSKNGYSLMMWGLVAVLGGLAAIVIFRSGNAKTEAVYRAKLYNELEEEYKAYKAKANAKEKKLARELQTERNRLDELMGRG